MTLTTTHISLIIAALVIVAALAFYAGKLLYQLKQQTRQQRDVQKRREQHLRQSIQTIAMALDQQQCSLSEGSIRLCVLLENLDKNQDHASHFPALHELYAKIKHMPTHDAYKALPKQDRMRMQMEREEYEAELESRILREIQHLKSY
ncbi:DUF2489 domain-containing protein [Bowmanella denitrificans]|uniref:DUF2489 domain-containing protein n=1 Tax=Bowmanella denitrificans TaxID=366582 RepID=UPI000C9AB054|nr:DUF2489 domain-containing protein [Bowmanella denitrificans]